MFYWGLVHFLPELALSLDPANFCFPVAGITGMRYEYSQSNTYCKLTMIFILACILFLFLIA
jgi:hypothetical protein